MPAMKRIAIAGASGYSGAELIRFLLRHPEVEIVHLVAGEQSDKHLAAVFPSLARIVNRVLEKPDWSAIGADTDVALLALPHGVGIQAVPALLGAGARVIDLGADFRLRDPQSYRRWYGAEHQAANLLDEAVYGLPELNRERIRSARLVANPGCYPTAAALALLPLAPRLDGLETIIVDAKSGVSGAGRKAALDYAFTEVNESVRAYGALSHRHQPEIEQTLADAGAKIRIAFVPHLIPMTRGILATCYVPLDGDLGELDFGALCDLYETRYSREPFVRFSRDLLPATKNTLGSNYCDVAIRVDQERRIAVAFGAIDNLVKGAAGQAIQNLNLMLGLDETTGLLDAPLFP